MEKSQNINYPKARKENMVETYHGTPVADPYRWLENDNAEETKAWMQAQNDLTSRFVAACPDKSRIEKRLAQLWNYPKWSLPYRKGNHYFFFKNEGLQNQPVLWRQEGLHGSPDLVLDPNQLSRDGTVAITHYAPNEECRLLAYSLAKSGSDWQEIRIRDLVAGKDYREVIKWCRYTGIAWKKDGSGFFYHRFPTPGSVAETDQYNYSRVYCHQAGTPQSKDQLVYERPECKEMGFSPQVTEDGRYLVLDAYHGTDSNNRIYYRDLQGDNQFVRLLDEADASYNFLGNQGTIFFFHTDFQAPRGRIIAIDIAQSQREAWREIVPQGEDAISSVNFIHQEFVVVYLHNAYHRLKIFSLDGKSCAEITLPTMGAISSLSGKENGEEMFFEFTSFLLPATIFRYDFAAKKLGVFKKPEIAFDAGAYETRQVFVESKDGTRVPMFLTHKKGMVANGDNPVFLYGYGGFQICRTPAFAPSELLWLEMGGIYAVANLRGGLEYGEEWHRGGMLQNKQNVFNDFIAAAEWLIANKYTRRDKLVIYGRSNGGLLVSACSVQRPDLFGAVLCQNPVIDMLRYHKFTVGRYWMGEYGNPELPEHFAFLRAYSPLHNIRAGVAYPAMLVTTADHDDRVVPAHANKFVAAIQEMADPRQPILLRVEKKAGHGFGKPVSKIIKEETVIYTFLFTVLGLRLPLTKRRRPSSELWWQELPGSVMVCDREGIILLMNDKARQSFGSDGGERLLGTNVLDCHPEPSRSKLKNMLASGEINRYTIEKNGVKKLIYQSPWYCNGVYQGFVELALEIPFDMPHFVRKSKAPTE